MGRWVLGNVGLSLLLAGCGGRDVEQVQLTGKVTLDGGPMPGPGTVFFNPVSAAGDAPLRPGSALFDADGHYTAGSFEEGDGLIPGQYRVAVHCWEVSPHSEDAVPISYIPDAYTDATRSGLSVEIPAHSGSVTKDFNLRSEP